MARATTTEDLVKVAQSQGFRVKRTKKGVMIYGRQPGTGMVLLHFTCSDNRAIKNAIAGLRKIGVEFER